jgi:hypothetical protein
MEVRPLALERANLFPKTGRIVLSPRERHFVFIQRFARFLRHSCIVVFAPVVQAHRHLTSTLQRGRSKASGRQNILKRRSSNPKAC